MPIIGNLKGPVGLAGAVGAAGPAGATGATGPAGISSFATGGNLGTAALAATGTQTVTMDSSIKTVTPTAACTFNASGGVAGQRVTFVVTAGASSVILTWSTNFKAAGTLTTGNTAGKVFCVSFVSTNGTLWCETGRTAAM